jgi:Ni/Co efflux regulator RcnB
MKKIITLLITFGAFATSFAQSPTTDKAKKVITKEPRNTTSYPNDRRVDDETSTRYPT